MSSAEASEAGERFFRRVHDRAPDAMSEFVHAHPLADGRTSYDLVAEKVTGAERVLDLGCGDGSLLALLAGQGARDLAGIDLSAGHIEAARARPELAAADVRIGRAQQLPFADNSFDAVVSHMAMMLMADIKHVIAHLARVLRPGGILVVAVSARPAPGSGYELFQTLARPFYAQIAALRRMSAPGDRRTRTQHGLDELLTPAGFEPVDWQQVTLGPTGTPDEVWELASRKHYETTLLDDTQRRALRQQFLTRAADHPASPRIPVGHRVSLAVTRLAA